MDQENMDAHRKILSFVYERRERDHVLNNGFWKKFLSKYKYTDDFFSNLTTKDLSDIFNNHILNNLQNMDIPPKWMKYFSKRISPAAQNYLEQIKSREVRLFNWDEAITKPTRINQSAIAFSYMVASEQEIQTATLIPRSERQKRLIDMRDEMRRLPNAKDYSNYEQRVLMAHSKATDPLDKYIDRIVLNEYWYEDEDDESDENINKIG